MSLRIAFRGLELGPDFARIIRSFSPRTQQLCRIKYSHDRSRGRQRVRDQLQQLTEISLACEFMSL